MPEIRLPKTRLSLVGEEYQFPTNRPVKAPGSETVPGEHPQAAEARANEVADLNLKRAAMRIHGIWLN